MKVLIYGLNFSPELTGIGKYTGEMAAWLAARGHEVQVVTAPPYYPQWRVADYPCGRNGELPLLRKMANRFFYCYNRSRKGNNKCWLL